jgi:predicted O-methyltransferase YrrM
MQPSQESLDILRKVSEKIETWHHHHHILYDIAREYPENSRLVYCEIGCYDGASAAMMIHRPKTKVVSIDSNAFFPKERVINNVQKYNTWGNEFHYLIGNSRDDRTRDLLKQVTDKIDILFIDGSHAYIDALLDFIEYQEFVDGYIVFDDYSDDTVPGVRKAVDNIVKVLSGWEIIGTFKNTLGARGVFRDDKGNCFVIRKGV